MLIGRLALEIVGAFHDYSFDQIVPKKSTCKKGGPGQTTHLDRRRRFAGNRSSTALKRANVEITLVDRRNSPYLSAALVPGRHPILAPSEIAAADPTA